MKDPTELRHNLTGTAVAPERAREMVEDAEMLTGEQTHAEGLALDVVRATYILDAEPAGTMPPAAGLKEAAKAALERLRGKNAAVLLDALGARLAFERTGVRLYEALLTKARTLGQEGGPSASDLSEIWNDELAHFQLLQDVVEQLGGDPTAMTPSANLEAVLSMGPLQVVSDPRLNLRESLHAALLVELADNDSWELLIRTAESLGQTELARAFEPCLAAEKQHLTRVRAWLATMTESLAGHVPEAESLPPIAA
jgi:ferritin-like metal-binding protein YciE